MVSNGGLPNNDENRCRYHTDTGCGLVTTISPVCLGYICKPLADYLLNGENPKETYLFLKSLGKVCSTTEKDYSKERINHRLERSITLGNHLLSVSTA